MTHQFPILQFNAAQGWISVQAGPVNNAVIWHREDAERLFDALMHHALCSGTAITQRAARPRTGRKPQLSLTDLGL